MPLPVTDFIYGALAMCSPGRFSVMCFLLLAPLAAGDECPSFKPIDPKIFSPYQFLGAKQGILRIRPWFFDFAEDTEAKSGGIPAIQVSIPLDSRLEELPKFDAPYALVLPETVTDEKLKQLRFHKDVIALNLGFTQVADAGLRELKLVDKLKYLNLGNTKILESGLKELIEMERLEVLQLVDVKIDGRHIDLSCRLTDVGMGYLGRMKNLTSVVLIGAQITDTGLIEIRDLKNLTYLRVDECTRITGTGVRNLEGLEQLRVLCMVGTKITDEGLDSMVGMNELEGLDLSGTGITDMGVATLLKLQSLKRLGLGQTRITGAGLKRLSELPGLKELYVCGTEVSESDVRELTGALPELKVRFGADSWPVLASPSFTTTSSFRLESKGLLAGGSTEFGTGLILIVVVFASVVVVIGVFANRKGRRGA
jgi:hypothetical protein